uniref:Uncharacterized protein n=1 Tax=Coccidioides posadasii RMSCC 3488 TaxID=454284 RepID=A0A0J6F921_COCPO|nr:hypothetical protein CPAG_02103 [Coccidioides posadasii RMSCC 3488]
MREKRSGKQDQGKFLDKEKRWKKSTNKESLRDISEFERSGYPHETSVVRAGPNGANWRRKGKRQGCMALWMCHLNSICMDSPVRHPPLNCLALVDKRPRIERH